MEGIAKAKATLHPVAGCKLIQQKARYPAAHRLAANKQGQVWIELPLQLHLLAEGLLRYPIEHTRFSKPLPGDSWWHHPKAPHLLKPGPADSSHPYPVELDLPSWTVAADIDLRSWLFAFGGGIRIESPDALKQELVDRCREAIEANGSRQPSSEPAEPALRSSFSNRLRND